MYSTQSVHSEQSTCVGCVCTVHSQSTVIAQGKCVHKRHSCAHVYTAQGSCTDNKTKHLTNKKQHCIKDMLSFVLILRD